MINHRHNQRYKNKVALISFSMISIDLNNMKIYFASWNCFTNDNHLAKIQNPKMWRFRKYGGLAKCEFPFDGHDFSLTAPSMSMRVCSAHMSMRAYATLPTISDQSMASLLPGEESCSSKYKDTRSLGSTLMKHSLYQDYVRSKIKSFCIFPDFLMFSHMAKSSGPWEVGPAHVHCALHLHVICWQIEWFPRRKGRFEGRMEGTSWLGSRRKEGVFYCSGSVHLDCIAHADLRQMNILIMESVIHILNVGAELIFGSNFSAVIKL